MNIDLVHLLSIASSMLNDNYGLQVSMFVTGETLEIGNEKVTQQVRAQHEEFIKPVRKLDDPPQQSTFQITGYLALTSCHSLLLWVVFILELLVFSFYWCLNVQGRYILSFLQQDKEK